MGYLDFSRLISESQGENGSFIDYFVRCLREVHCEYVSRNLKIPVDRRKFNATGVTETIDNYVWPATLSLPSRDVSLILSNWQDTQAALEGLSDRLREAVNQGNGAMPWISAILQWGMGQRGASTLRYFEELDVSGNLYSQLQHLRDFAHFNADIDALQLFDFSRYNSGIAKISSLLSAEGVIIYDSRVAFALGEIVNNWLKLNEFEAIPEHLNFLQMGRHGNFPRFTERYRHHRVNYNSEISNLRWVKSQLSATWLIQIALERNVDIFPAESINSRIHKVEAALFMWGAYSHAMTLPEFQH